MFNKPSIKELKSISDLYSTEGIELEEKVIHLHFFIGSCDWYICEISHEDLNTMFGYVNLGDPVNAEWGYVSLDELVQLKISFVEVDRDLYWKPTKVKDIPGIMMTM